MRAKSGEGGKMSSIFNTTDFSSTFEGGNKIKKSDRLCKREKKTGFS